MQFYMRIEHFRNGVFAGKNLSAFEASDLVDALRRTADFLGGEPSFAEERLPAPEKEIRITVGAVLEFKG